MLRTRVVRFAFVDLLLVVVLSTVSCCRRPAPTSSDCPPSAPGIVFASISVRCGQDIYTVSTGNTSGECEATEGPSGNGLSCDDKRGNGASMACVGGVGKCLESSGAGSCTIKAE
jgi:hypothetical protein